MTNSGSKRDVLRTNSKKYVTEINKGSTGSEIILPTTHNVGMNTFHESFEEISMHATKANIYFKEKNYEDSNEEYYEAISIIDSILQKLSANSNKRQDLIKKRNTYLKKIEVNNRYIQVEPNIIITKNKELIKRENTNNNEDEYLAEVIIYDKDDFKTFPNEKDIIGLNDAKEKLEFQINFPLQNPELKGLFVQSDRRILLYGAPGNGKTDLMRMAAKKYGVNMIVIKPSDIFTKYLGDSNKFLKANFKKAKQNQPSMIFIDEIDSIGGSRGDESSETSRRVKNELFQLMQGFETDADDLIWVVGATNRPQDLDSALRRRFPNLIFVSSPDEKDRKQLVKTKLTNNLPEIQKISDDVDFDEISKLLDGYSSSDITGVVQAVRQRPALELFRNQKNNSDKTSKDELRAISQKDFIEVINQSNPSLNKDEEKAIKEWGQRHSSE